MLYVKLFGAPSLAWNGEAFELSRRQARALLFRLAADPDPISREELMFLFWPDIADARARKNLSRLTSYLGQSLPEATILQAGRDAIGLDQERVSVDSQRFERLLRENEAESLEQAVALYGGRFLSGVYLANAVEYEQWLARRAERLEGDLRSALDSLIKLKESAGDLDSAIGYGQRYLALDDLAEEIHRRLMKLYIKSGDRAAALRQYESCVAVLERELGVSPLPETRQMYDAALANQIQAIPVPPEIVARWTVLPTLQMPMIGRDRVYSQLEQAFERSLPGGMVFISGEPGIGKTRLLREFATDRANHLLLSGACYRKGLELPFQPLVQALRPALADRILWQTIRPIWLAEIAAILPEIEEQFVSLPSRLQVQPDQAQVRIFEALAQVVSGLATRRPLLLCLDDLHWADDATLAWLTYFAGRPAAARVRMLATFRTNESGPLTGLRDSLARAGLQEEVPLSGLSAEDIADIIDRLLPSESEHIADRRRLAAEIHRITSGNAFFVLETLRNLLENQQLGEPITAIPLAPTVQAAIRRRLERLDPLARQILDAAAIVFPSITFEQVTPVSGRSEVEVVNAIELLVGRQLLTVQDDALQFQHELARAVVYEDLSPWRRRLLHRRAAEALADTHRGRTLPVAARIAGHYESAGAIEPAIAYYREAAGAAREQYAYQEANHYLQRIIDLSFEDSKGAGEIGLLYEMMADNSRAVTHFIEAEAAYRQALAIGPSEPSLRRADILRKLAAAIKPAMRFEEANDLYQRALAELDQAPAETEVDRRHLWLRLQLDRQDSFYIQGRLEEMIALKSEIEPRVRALNVPEIWSQYYASVTRMRSYQERFRLSAETVGFGRQRLNYALLSGNVREIAEHQFGLGFLLLWSGSLDEAIAQLRVGLTTCEEIGHTYVMLQCLAYLTIAHRLRGEVDQTRRYLEKSLQLTDAEKHRYYVAVDHSSLSWLAYQESNWVKALAEARTALSLLADTKYPFRWLAYWIILAHNNETGDLVEAAESAEDMLSPVQQRLPEDVTSVLAALVGTVASGDKATGRQALSRALELAKLNGYL